MSVAAITEVTRGLRMLLHSQLIRFSPSAVVTLRPPGESLPDVSGVNLYLYRVVESPASKNQPWPGDRTTQPSDLPALGLQLSYLLTPLAQKPADDSFQLGDDAHLMLGAAMLTLQESPVLNEVHLPGFDADGVLPEFLLNSYEQVHITLLPTSLEELSKIWATINQPYRLSVAYEVSMVQLTPTLPPPVRNGRVLTTIVNVAVREAPQVSLLTPAAGPLAHLDSGGAVAPNQLRISGSGLDSTGAPTIVWIGGRQAAMEAAARSARGLTASMPDDLEAGPQVDVRVTVNGVSSASEPFAVTPWLARIAPIRTALDPAIQADQRLTLDGAGFNTPLRSVRLEGPGGVALLTAPESRSSEQAIVALPASLANGIYTVRVVLNDQANSVTNTRTLEVIPRVDRPIQFASPPLSERPQLTLNGGRLNGGDVRLVIDDVEHQHGANPNGNQLVHALARSLDKGVHRIAVRVNGQMSRPVEVEI